MNEEQAIEELRRAMIFKHGAKVAEIAAEIAQQLAIVIAVKADVHDVKAMAVMRCVADTLATMIRKLDEEFKEREEKTGLN